MELMLRFCDGGVVIIAVLSGVLSTIASVFLPVSVLAPASFPGHPEELPRLDRPFDQDLVSQPHPIRRSRIREPKTRPRRRMQQLSFSLRYIIEAVPSPRK